MADIGTPFKEKGWRKVHINGVAWGYTFGMSCVMVHAPSGKRLGVNPHDIAGVTAEEFIEAQHARTSVGAITPAKVKHWIETNCM